MNFPSCGVALWQRRCFTQRTQDKIRKVAGTLLFFCQTFNNIGDIIFWQLLLQRTNMLKMKRFGTKGSQNPLLNN